MTKWNNQHNKHSYKHSYLHSLTHTIHIKTLPFSIAYIRLTCLVNDAVHNKHHCSSFPFDTQRHECRQGMTCSLGQSERQCRGRIGVRGCLGRQWRRHSSWKSDKKWSKREEKKEKMVKKWSKSGQKEEKEGKKKKKWSKATKKRYVRVLWRVLVCKFNSIINGFVGEFVISYVFLEAIQRRLAHHWSPSSASASDDGNHDRTLGKVVLGKRRKANMTKKVRYIWNCPYSVNWYEKLLKKSGAQPGILSWSWVSGQRASMHCGVVQGEEVMCERARLTARTDHVRLGCAQRTW